MSRRSSTIPSAPSRSSLRTAWETSPCAPEVKPARCTWPTLREPWRSIEDSTTGMSTCARSSLTSRSRLPDFTVSVTDVPAGPLMRAVEASEEEPAIERPLTAIDDVAGLQAALVGGRAVVDRHHAQALVGLLDGHADAGELALRDLLEVRVVLRREVVGELVVERLDRGAERLVQQLVAVDPAVVVAVDDVHGLLVDLRVAVVDEPVAQEARQHARMAAEPDARDEQDGHEHGYDQDG